MALATPSHLRAFLEQMGASPKKSLSQNFLIDRNILHKIVALAGIQKGDLVLEIGCGPGALTETLLEYGASLIAIEKDEKFAGALSRFPLREIFSGDVREYPFEKLEGEKIKVVANLPYHLTSPILGLLLPKKFFSEFTFMVQEEVARRMTALPGNKDYSSLTLFLQYYVEAHFGFSVSRGCFYPSPKVTSAVVHLKRKERKNLLSEEEFFPPLRHAFQHRRKMLRSSLASLAPAKNIEESLEKIGVRKEARPENLSFEEWEKFVILLLKK